MKYDNKYDMPSLLDKEIDKENEDAFGHRHYAQALKSLIESPQIKPPFSIGLLGKWGTGKSSIKTLYLSSLKDKDGKIVNNEIKPITFNAWRFGGENIKRALLRQVFLELEGDEKKLYDSLFCEIEKQTKEPKVGGEIWIEIKEKIFWGLSQFILLCFIGLTITNIILNNPTTSSIFGGLTFLTLIAQFFSDPTKIIINRYSDVKRVEKPQTSAEEYERLLKNQLNKYKNKHKYCKKVVIFVDDLDRLSAEEMVNGIDTIRSFMEMENLPDGLGIIFVVSCDEDRVADALANKRKSPDLLSTVFNPSDARRYLDRIFQFRIEIPQFPKQDMKNYILKKLENELPQVVSELKNTGVNVEILISRMIHLGVTSPRNALQILNTFLQSWWIAKRREEEGDGAEKPGGLKQGSVTEYLEALAVISVFKVDFPDFYKDLIQEPQLINKFSTYFIEGKSFENEPEVLKVILNKYFEVKKEGRDDGGSVNRLKIEYNQLGQFISSIQYVKWPTSIQPLLLLSQDPITRKYGNDKASLIRNSLLSNDYQGIIRNFGIKSTEHLSMNDVKLLRVMIDDLANESVDRQINASVLLAKLSNNISSEHANLVYEPLTRQLVKLAEIRWRIGLPKIKDIIFHGEIEDRREFVGILINELLQSNGSISYKLENGDSPSSEQIKEIVEIACNLALNIRKCDGLPALYDSKLLNWLISRKIIYNDETYEIPFAHFERWVSEHEDHLLKALGYNYTQLVLKQFETNELDNLNIQDILRKSKIVFQDLEQNGNLKILCKQLIQLISVKNEEAVTLAWQIMQNHYNLIDIPSYNEFITSFAERLYKEDNNEEWRMKSWVDAGKAFISMVTNRKETLNDDNYKKIIDLINTWSTSIDEGGNLAIELMGNLEDILSENVIDSWIENFERLNEPSIIYLNP